MFGEEIRVIVLLNFGLLLKVVCLMGFVINGNVMVSWIMYFVLMFYVLCVMLCFRKMFIDFRKDKYVFRRLGFSFL